MQDRPHVLRRGAVRRRVADLGIGKPVRIDAAQIGRRAARAPQMQRIDQQARFWPVGPGQHIQRRRQAAHGCEGAKLQAGAKGASRRMVAEPPEPLRRRPRIRLGTHHQHMARADGRAGVDDAEMVGIVRPGLDPDHLDIQHRNSRALGQRANLLGDRPGPGRRLDPDAHRRPARRNRRRRHLLGREFRQHPRGQGEKRIGRAGHAALAFFR